MCGRNLIRSKTYLDTDQGANGNLRKNLLPSPALTFFSLCVPLFLYSYSACIVDKVYGVGWWAANPALLFTCHGDGLDGWMVLRLGQMLEDGTFCDSS